MSADRAGAAFSPASPSGVSGHATVVTRTFPTLSAAAMENARSLLHLGVHYGWDVTQGYTTGTKVGTYVSGKLLQKVIGGGTYPTASACETTGDDAVYGNVIYSGYYCRQDGATSWRLVFHPWP